jgi:CRP-like cAMP-binding protein/cytochrome P450/bacterioferritin-associated ferredoxin
MESHMTMESQPHSPERPTAADFRILRNCALIVNLGEDDRRRVLDAVAVAKVPAGDNIIAQGTIADAFYVLLTGKAEVLKDEDGEVVNLTKLEPGTYFGEQALLGKNSGRRSTTVRAIDDCRVAFVSADVFGDAIAASVHNRERFEGDASTYVYREINKSLNAFIATELDESAEGVERLRFHKGEILTREGDRSDSAFLILSGVAVVYKSIDGQRREVSRMGGGQICGELGVLKGEPRSATVVAYGDMEVLQISADAFVRWYKAHPDLSGFFNSLSQVYKLSKGRQMSVFWGQVGSHDAVTSVVGRPTDGVVAVRVLDQGRVVFVNAGAGAVEGERCVMTYANDRIERELRVIVKERKSDRIDRCIVYAVSATGIETDLGTLYQHVLQLDELQAVALRRFERTGFLGGKADRTERLCQCLGLGRQELVAAVGELGDDFATLQDNIGVSGICGGCEPIVREFLAKGASIHPQPRRTDPAADAGGPDAVAPAAADVPPDLLIEEEKRLAALLSRGMGADLPAVTREQVAVRLRATGVRDTSFFIDMFFSGVFGKYARATYATLALAVSRSVGGFGPLRQDASQSKSPAVKLGHKAVLAVYPLGRKGIVAALAVVAGISIAAVPQRAVLFWVAFLAGLGLAYAGLSLRPSGRFMRTLITGGPARFYRALYKAFGREKTVGVLKMTPFGPPHYVVRDGRLIDHILQNPHIYAREPLAGYTAFGQHSVFGAGSGGAWLGYRMLFEEYLSGGYQADLEQMRDIVRERIKMWQGRNSIDLLMEIYRINIEIHARLFFQTTFDCFNDNAAVDFAGIVDRVLSLPTILPLGGTSNGEVDTLRRKVLDAVKGSTRKESIGGIMLDALRAGDLNEGEVCENGVMYMLAAAPVMGIFWTLYRAARDGGQARLRTSRKEIVKAIKESLRRHAPVAEMLTRKVLRDDRIDGLDVKAGDMIRLFPMYIHTSDKQWTRPFDYDPDRWTVHVGAAKEIVESKTDPADAHSRPQGSVAGEGGTRYLPFGGGGQACQGRWLATEEMLIVVEEIVKHYDLQILEDKGLLAKPSSDQVVLHVYNRPFNDVRMKPVALLADVRE